MTTLQSPLKIKPGTAYYISNPANVYYLTGFRGSLGYVLLTNKKAYFLTDFRYLSLAKETISAKFTVTDFGSKYFGTLNKLLSKHKIQTLFFEENHLTYEKFASLKKNIKCESEAKKSKRLITNNSKTKKSPAPVPLPIIKLLPKKHFVENLRIQKSESEISNITKAQRITEQIFYAIKKRLRKGKTEIQIANEIIDLSRKLGAEGVSFEPIVAFGKNSAHPHHLNTTKKLKKGDLILIDMGVKYQGYCSDMTRIIFTAPPTKEQKKIYELVLRAQTEAIKNIRAGLSTQKVDYFARKIIDEAGYKSNFGHALGHGVGLEIHENPKIPQSNTTQKSTNSSNDTPLPENSVITVEPGIYLEDKFGIRLEDMIVVQRRGAKNLTLVSKKIEDSIQRI